MYMVFNNEYGSSKYGFHTINPVTGKKYLDLNSSLKGDFENNSQLKLMEENEPSLHYHSKALFSTLYNDMSLLHQSFQNKQAHFKGMSCLDVEENDSAKILKNEYF